LFWRHFHPQYPTHQHWREDYEHDADGRLTKIVRDFIWPDGVPDVDPPIDTTRFVITYDYSTVQMTENGYIFDGIEYELDNHGRLTHAKYVNSKDEFVEFTDGKKYRIDSPYYSYTDSSWTSFGYYQPGDMVPGMPDQWIETTYVFDENENEKQRTVRVSSDGINWTIHELTKTEYVYSSAVGIPMLTPPAAQTGTTVYAHSGAIHIVAENAVRVQIFDLFGRLVKQQAVMPGENRISGLSGGFYIVSVSNESYKVFIK